MFDRNRMMANGAVFVSIYLDASVQNLHFDITLHGISENIMRDKKNVIICLKNKLSKLNNYGKADFRLLKNASVDALKNLFWDKFKKRPLIVVHLKTNDLNNRAETEEEESFDHIF